MQVFVSRFYPMDMFYLFTFLEYFCIPLVFFQVYLWWIVIIAFRDVLEWVIKGPHGFKRNYLCAGKMQDRVWRQRVCHFLSFIIHSSLSTRASITMVHLGYLFTSNNILTNSLISLTVSRLNNLRVCRNFHKIV